MANMGAIAGMLAQSGANIGQAIGAPVQRLGQNIGGMLSQRAEDRRTGEKEAEAKALIEQYKDNPAQLRAIAQEYAIKQDPLAQVFASAAQTSRAKREREMAGMEASRGFAKERAKAARASVDAAGTELERTRLEQNAIKKARATGDENIIEGLRGADSAALRSYLMEKPKEGSKTKGYKVEKNVVIDGVEQSVVEFFDAEGNFLNRKVIGEVAPDRDEAKGRADWSVTEGKAYTQTVNDQRAASEDSRKYSSLLQETIDIAGESGQVGGVLGMARDFVISDVAGLGDAISVHRSRLNEVRMQNAIALLPRGPASDRDVRLALDASVDPKNLSAEDRIAYIRGVAKIAAAEKEYMDGKLRWIEQTGDALAFGYERKVSLDGMDKQVESFKTDNSLEVSVLEGELEKVKALAGSGKTEEAKELLNYIKSIDGIGYLALLEEREAEQQRYDKFLEQNNINFF